MRLPKWEYERLIGEWRTGIIVCPGLWVIGLYWLDDPVSIHLSLPFMMLSIERDREYHGKSWDCCWFLLRFLIGKQELRLDFDLHGLLIGVKMFETNDWSLHVGPLDLECEWSKLYRNEEWPMKPTVRLFSTAEPRCDCMGTEPK